MPKKQYRLISRRTLPHDPNFNKSNYKPQHVYEKDGILIFTLVDKNYKHLLFEFYIPKERKLEKIDFVKEIRKLRRLFNEGHDSNLEYQRFQKWYKRVITKVAYEAIKFRGYEHGWDEINKTLPSILQVSEEKMKTWCGQGTLMAYNSLFNKIWSDKKYPDPVLVGAEIASHFLNNYLKNGRTVKLNPLEREAEEWIEKMTELHLRKITGKKLTRSSLSDKEIENIQIAMRFGPQDPHAGYYEADLELLEKLEKSSPRERRETLSYGGYRNLVIKSAKTPKKRFFTSLNMLNVIAGTPFNHFDKQKQNIKDMISVLYQKQ